MIGKSSRMSDAQKITKNMKGKILINLYSNIGQSQGNTLRNESTLYESNGKNVLLIFLNLLHAFVKV